MIHEAVLNFEGDVRAKTADWGKRILRGLGPQELI
jgi:hypothetical protein